MRDGTATAQVVREHVDASVRVADQSVDPQKSRRERIPQRDVVQMDVYSACFLIF